MSHPYLRQGYLPPDDAYLQPAIAGPDPNDPLVNPQGAYINGWFSRVGGVFKRSWKSMAAIFAITQLLPLIVFSVLGLVAVLVLGMVAFGNVYGTPLASRPDSSLMGISIPVVIVSGLLVALAMLVLQSAGYAAATYAVTREAAGHRVRLGEALGYGFRRAFGLARWQLAVIVLMILGLVACVLPAFYVYAATALFGPIYLFERRSPIGRTFAIFNKNVGRVLGRLALIMVATIAVSMAGNVFDLMGNAVAGASQELPVRITATVVSSTFGLLLQLPLTMLTFSGILLTYAEQRGYEGPVNVRTLAEDL